VENTFEGSVFSCCLTKKALDTGAIGDVGFDEFDAFRDQIAAGVAEIVDDNDLVSLADEEFRYGTSDISGAAGNHDLHKKFALFASICC